ncbi:acetyl-CoA hydrolase/transferase C-terminal domain-containing protein [Natronorubrum sp. FCH18a]|uniref:acetyl-CoA hydrolase/transferase C-terminal domain-containing protein n=1 Tax=Natronorubrum sp. FCH18a TaxID=3447018 RepID=UPI003F511721
MIQDRLIGEIQPQKATPVASEIGSDDGLFVSGFGRVGYPKAIPRALARSDRDLNLTIVSGGVVGDEIDTDLVEQNAIDRRYAIQTSSVIQDAINHGAVQYSDRHLSRVGLEARTGHFGDPDWAIIEAIAVGDGWLVPSASIGATPAFVDAADNLIVELNEAQPLELQHFHDIYRRELPPDRSPIPLTEPGGRIGSRKVTFDSDKLHAVVRTSREDSSYEFREPTGRHRTIADNLIEFLLAESDRNPVHTDKVVLQFGVGSLGNALMGSISSADLSGREVAYFGEVFQDGLLNALDSGTISVASATSLALSKSGRDRLFRNIDRYTDKIVLRNSNISNHPGLIDRFGVVSINSVLEVDIYGRANATHIGSDIVNGIGGGGDFTRSSQLGILVLGSTAKDGEISRIVPMVSHPDYTEHDYSIVISERGVADLRGLSPTERSEAIVENCAHPRFRDDLRRYRNRADEGAGHEPHELDACFSWRRDTG